MKGNRISFDIDLHHPLVIKLIAATESGDAAKVKRLMRNFILPVAHAKAASLVLSAIDPFNNPTLSAECLWGFESHKPKDKRPGKRKLLCILQRIAKSVDLLLDAGADPDTVDHQGCSVICKIVMHRNLLNILLRLLEAGVNPNSHDGAGATALYLAVVWKNYEGVRLLLKYGADPGRPFENITPLMFAAANQQLGILRNLINAGADFNVRDKDGRSVLMLALRRQGDHPFLVMYRWARESAARQYPKKATIGITKLLIESGAEYQEPDNMGYIPVDYAMVANINGVELPVELTVNQVYLKFCAAAKAGDSQQLSSLLQTEEIPTRIRSIALTLVAVRGFEECCKVLLEHDTDVNKVNQCGNSPAEAAAIGLQLPIMKLLVAYGLSHDGMNIALTYICMALAHYYGVDKSTFHRKRLELARYLLEQGADPNTQYEDFGGLLTVATLIDKNIELERLLLEFGAVPFDAR